MKSKFVLAALAAFAVATPALAADRDDAGKPDSPKEKLVCRTEGVTGSLIAKHRICKTQAQWDELAAETKRQLDEYGHNQNLGSDTGSGSGANNKDGL